MTITTRFAAVRMSADPDFQALHIPAHLVDEKTRAPLGPEELLDRLPAMHVTVGGERWELVPITERALYDQVYDEVLARKSSQQFRVTIDRDDGSMMVEGEAGGWIRIIHAVDADASADIQRRFQTMDGLVSLIALPAGKP